jgi:hypothetical protein
MILIWILAALGTVLLLGALVWGLHRFCLRLEERGWIYYRTKPQGGGGLSGAMMELDALVRPNVVHMMEAQDAVLEKRNEDDQGDSA